MSFSLDVCVQRHRTGWKNQCHRMSPRMTLGLSGVVAREFLNLQCSGWLMAFLSLVSLIQHTHVISCSHSHTLVYYWHQCNCTISLVYTDTKYFTRLDQAQLAEPVPYSHPPKNTITTVILYRSTVSTRFYSVCVLCIDQVVLSSLHLLSGLDVNQGGTNHNCCTQRLVIY